MKWLSLLLAYLPVVLHAITAVFCCPQQNTAFVAIAVMWRLGQSALIGRRSAMSLAT